jgi:hypothetical protein
MHQSTAVPPDLTRHRATHHVPLEDHKLSVAENRTDHNGGENRQRRNDDRARDRARGSAACDYVG